MSSDPTDGEDENDVRNSTTTTTSSDHHHHHHHDPARDFMPPRSYVRKRQLPIFHSPTTYAGGSREADESLAAYKAVSEQLARTNTWQRTGSRGGIDRKPINSKSSASSISSAGGNSILNDAFSSDLIRGPVGSFAEDSPIRDRDSPNNSYRATYAMAFSPPYDSSDQHRFTQRQTQDPGRTTDNLFAKWSTRLPESNASASDGLNLSPAKASPTSKHVTRDWNDLFQNYDDVHLTSPAAINRTLAISPSKTTMAISKKLSMQDVFRSPPTHDLKKRTQLPSSPSFSFGGIDTPGAQSNGFSPVPEYPSDDDFGNGAQKFSRLRFQSSFDDDNVNTDDEQFDFIPSFPPAATSAHPSNELEGVRRSPLQSSERKSSSLTQRPDNLPFSDNLEIKSKRGKKSFTPSKSAKKKTPKKASTDHLPPWTDATANTENIRRVTMGEPQSSQSLADINNMMRRDQTNVASSTKTSPKPKTPAPKKPAAMTQESATKRAKTPVQSDSAPPEAQPKESQKTDTKPQQKQAGDRENETSVKTDVLKTNETTKEYQYPYRHGGLIPHHYGPYPTSSVPPFHHDYHSHTSGRSQHILPPVHYPPHHPPAHLPMHYTQPPSSSPLIPPRYPERRASSPAIPPGYAMPSTPRFQNGYVVRNQTGSASMYSATRPRISGPPPPFGWPISASAASSRYSSPAVPHPSHSIPSNVRPTPARPISHLNLDKENSNNKNDGAPAKSKRNPCNCKKSRCLKLYCECFSAQIFCEGCNCADCYNTEGHYEIREKAMKELLHKNKTAFDVKTPGTIAIGCKCKRSECLKKYCECFQAGIVCVDLCKCVSCANRAGSQKLIDKRRKMKDTKGAEYAMQISREVWEQQPRAASITNKPPMIASRDAVMNRPVVHHSIDVSVKPSRLHSSRPAQLGPPMMGNVGFSPMDHATDGTSRVKTIVDEKVTVPPMTTPKVPVMSTVPSTSTMTADRPIESFPTTNAVAVTDSVNKSGIATGHPETPAGVRRLSFDSTTTTQSASKKQKPCLDGTTSVHYFGHALPPLSSTMMARIIQFLPESDLHQIARVCEQWKTISHHQ